MHQIVCTYLYARSKLHSAPNLTCIFQVLTEIKGDLGGSALLTEVAKKINYLEYLAYLPDNLIPIEAQSPVDGSYGICFREWFWKLEASTDVFLTLDVAPEHSWISLMTQSLCPTTSRLWLYLI